MKMIPPQPFTYEAGRRAVLLLHGFTGNPADVRKLGRYLHRKGYTCHAPLYTGHGDAPEELLDISPQQWWRDAELGYKLLREKGYDEIAAAGVSLGGVFALRLGADAAQSPVKGVVSMCAPIRGKSADDLFERVLGYARTYKTFEGKAPEIVQAETENLKSRPRNRLSELQELISQTGGVLEEIESPVYVMQGGLDSPLYLDSADVIYSLVSNPRKRFKTFPDSGHILTLGPEQEQVFEEVYRFLEGLDWEEL
ncbi:alpha/beta fold hydrolase [Saccharibacillus sp. CPCC 101409]|uniref:alpha/beta hydrolase n=1 Tax=Saccharibacillus sp. CPCC 101409 TaxID=3058041 RepID=UPI002671A931|nr:alpha/beta fold hydrolase [Saccharibacillus sp. CPCC 101409]MDO3413363.1 alpha/beta fold hydrolase [Saccharibacillus sp. CPCC 101409]